MPFESSQFLHRLEIDVVRSAGFRQFLVETLEFVVDVVVNDVSIATHERQIELEEYLAQATAVDGEVRHMQVVLADVQRRVDETDVTVEQRLSTLAQRLIVQLEREERSFLANDCGETRVILSG